MKEDNLIHVKLKHEEAFQAKKDILYLEMDLLKISKTVKNYHRFRSDQLELKLNFYKKIKEAHANIRKLQVTLPKLKIPKILKKDEDIEETDKDKLEKPVQETKHDRYDSDLEAQLQEIQEKLSSLHG